MLVSTTCTCWTSGFYKFQKSFSSDVVVLEGYRCFVSLLVPINATYTYENPHTSTVFDCSLCSFPRGKGIKKGGSL